MARGANHHACIFVLSGRGPGVHRSLGRRSAREGVFDVGPGLLKVKRFLLQNCFMRAFDAMAPEAGRLAIGNHEAVGDGLVAVEHDFADGIFAARTVAGFALQAIFNVKGFGALPILGLRGGGVAAQAHARALRLFRDAAQFGNALGLRQRQRGVGASVGAAAPDAELVTGSRVPMTSAANFHTDIDRMLVRPSFRAGGGPMPRHDGEKQENASQRVSEEPLSMNLGWGETLSNPDFFADQDSRARRSLAPPLDGFRVPRHAPSGKGLPMNRQVLECGSPLPLSPLPAKAPEGRRTPKR